MSLLHKYFIDDNGVILYIVGTPSEVPEAVRVCYPEEEVCDPVEVSHLEQHPVYKKKLPPTGSWSDMIDILKKKMLLTDNPIENLWKNYSDMENIKPTQANYNELRSTFKTGTLLMYRLLENQLREDKYGVIDLIIKDEQAQGDF